MKTPRLAARALIIHEDRLLLVNAFAAHKSDLWCAPGGGVNAGTSLPENLTREVYEETGMTVIPGAPALINEFHDPATGFHQVEIFFRCQIASGSIDQNWRDPEGVVTKRRFFTRDELRHCRAKPDSLADAAWGTGIFYDALERMVR
jgi:8-oxo-dGTP diphosphatase